MGLVQFVLTLEFGQSRDTIYMIKRLYLLCSKTRGTTNDVPCWRIIRLYRLIGTTAKFVHLCVLSDDLNEFTTGALGQDKLTTRVWLFGNANIYLINVFIVSGSSRSYILSTCSFTVLLAYMLSYWPGRNIFVLAS